jgi:hypothetical protein
LSLEYLFHVDTDKRTEVKMKNWELRTY